ncbi:hypothetical protein ACJ73_08526 [Blastomyces percursus]|uniref:Uncharacterized protein n=1 Tax=Blastomyces percursus TaxID=1658174 RepID=A0A1J9PV30_9EURO|nr:hypothetical protein ACJ73_08526 [Blastomyces percursus]
MSSTPEGGFMDGSDTNEVVSGDADQSDKSLRSVKRGLGPGNTASSLQGEGADCLHLGARDGMREK